MTMDTDKLREIAKVPDVQAAARWLVEDAFSEGANFEFAVSVLRHQSDKDPVVQGDWDAVTMLALLEAEPAESMYHGH
jgi:hypothetical protein